MSRRARGTTVMGAFELERSPRRKPLAPEGDLFGMRPADRRPDSLAEKVAHVKSAGQTRAHGCHWPGCPRQVPPAMWGCKEHWFALPKPIRDAIWRAYRVGQETSLTPSRAYVEAARRAQDWIAANGGGTGALL